MGMACERIPLRYGVRSDHLLCSVLFISGCIGTLEIIGILIHVLNGEISKFATVCMQGLAEGVRIVFPCPATEGQCGDRQLQRWHCVTARGDHMMCYHLKVINSEFKIK